MSFVADISTQAQADRILSSVLALDTTSTPEVATQPPTPQQSVEGLFASPGIAALFARMREVHQSMLKTEVATKDGVMVIVDTTGIESAINTTPFDRCSSNAERQQLHDRTCRAVAAHTKAEIDSFHEFWGQNFEADD